MEENNNNDISFDEEDSQPSTSRRNIYIIIASLGGVILGIIFVLLFFMGRGAEPLSFIPEETQIIANVALKPGIKKTVIESQYEKALRNPSVISIGDKLMTALFFKDYIPGIDVTKNFLPYVEPDIAIGFFNIGKNLARRLPGVVPTGDQGIPNIDTLGIFKIKNKEKVREFLNLVNEKYSVRQENSNGYGIYTADKFCYSIKEDFFIISSKADIVVLSLETGSGKHKNILDNNNLDIYKNRISDETVGFLFCNLSPLREEFYSARNLSSDSEGAKFLNSFKLIGASLAVSGEGIRLETLVLPEDNLQGSSAEKFFAQNPRLPTALSLLPRDNTTNVFLSTNSVDTFQSLKGVLQDLNLDPTQKLESMLKLNFERDIMGSLTGDLIFSLPSKNIQDMALAAMINPMQLIDGSIIIIGIKKDSRLLSILAGADSLMSALAPPPEYKGISVITSPDGFFSYFLLGDYMVVSIGSSADRIKSTIDTSQGANSTVFQLFQERVEGKLPKEVVSMSYINLKSMIPSSEALNKFPEIWSITTAEGKGFKSTLYMPVAF